jgi:hypothetical protein
MCSISRDPRREDHTICTAVAPDAVFTVRTYGTGPLYDPGLQRLKGWGLSLVGHGRRACVTGAGGGFRPMS